MNTKQTLATTLVIIPLLSMNSAQALRKAQGNSFGLNKSTKIILGVGIPATILTGLGIFGLKKHIDSKKVNNQNELPSNGGNAVINNTAPIAEPDATEDAQPAIEPITKPMPKPRRKKPTITPLEQLSSGNAGEDVPVEENAGNIPTPPPVPPIVTATKPAKPKKKYDARGIEITETTTASSLAKNASVDEMKQINKNVNDSVAKRFRLRPVPKPRKNLLK